MNKSIIKNMKFVTIAQCSNIVVSILMGLLLPKIISIVDYGYWQLFIVYCTCFELFLFGIPNGFFIKNAGKRNLDYNYQKSAFVFLMIVSSIYGFCIYIYSGYSISDESFVYYLLAVSVVIVNAGTYFSFLLQTENEIVFNSIATVILNLLIVISFGMLTRMEILSAEMLIKAFIFSHLIRTSLLLWKRKKVFYASISFKKVFWRYLFSDFGVGIKILSIDYTNILMFAICRIICKDTLGIIEFSKLSFSLSIVILSITFANQVSVSLLPSLRQLSMEDISEYYIKLRNFTSITFILILLLYQPVVYILSIWLPKYAGSFIYILFLFPLVIYDGKMQTLFSLFLKLLRYEHLLLKVNILYLFATSIIAFLSVIYTKNIQYMIFVILFMSCLRSTIVEYFISRLVKVSNYKGKILLEIWVGIVFIGANMYFNGIMAWLCSMIILSILLVINYFCFRLKTIKC